jgi:REP element-mobilizing transposase RayT
MANTYTQLYIQLVFAVEHRDRLIKNFFKEELHKYITGVIQNKKNKLLAINSMPDHTHIFIGLNPILSISELVKEVKIALTDFINDKKWVNGKYNWQKGFGAFSYSYSQIPKVINYINNQEKHHGVKTFREEYLNMLDSFAVKYDNKFLFKWFN